MPKRTPRGQVEHASLEDLFREAAEKLQVQKTVAEERIKDALADLGKACEEAGMAVNFRPPGAEVRFTYTPDPAATKKWSTLPDDTREEVMDEYDAWGNSYGNRGWHSSNIC